MKRIFNLTIKDFVNSFRDKMNVYIYIAPIIIAIAVRLFLPDLSGQSLKVAMLENSKSKTEISKYYNVIEVKDKNELYNRIKEYDDVVGIIYSNNNYEIVLEGNEEESTIQYAKIVITNIKNNHHIPISNENLGEKESNLKEIISAGVIMLIVGVAGMSMGFSIVEDKESKMIEAFGVSPINIFGYISSKLITTAILSILLAFIAQLIMVGFSFDLGQFLLVLFSAYLMSILIGFLMGTFADTQNSAIALVKIIIFFFVMLPMISLIVPKSIEWFFYIIPGYWIFKLLIGSLIGIEMSMFLVFLIAVAIHMIAIFALIPRMKKVFKLRTF